METFGKKLTQKEELVVKLILCNFRLISTHSTDTTDEVYDLLNFLDDLRQNNPSTFHQFDKLYLVLEMFLTNLSLNLGEQFLSRISVSLKNYLKGFIHGEVNAKMLEINLKFILELTNNESFMQ